MQHVEEEKDGWQTVVSKKTQNRVKQDVRRQRTEQIRKNRDVRYLHTHPGFQKYRIDREKASRLIENKSPIGSLYIVSNGRCVGHLIAVSADKQRCLECDWQENEGFVSHCCCADEVVAALPPNFYLGCEGYLNDYLMSMRDKPIVVEKDDKPTI